jgi:hypothetical protein
LVKGGAIGKDLCGQFFLCPLPSIYDQKTLNTRLPVR